MRAETNAAKFFDGFAETFDTIYDNKRNAIMQWVDWHFRSDMFMRFALTFNALGSLKDKTVLDIGCGSGPYVLEALHRDAKWVTAVDPAPAMLSLVRQRLKGTDLGNRCSIIEGCFPGIEVQLHDHAIIMGVMDYIPDAVSFLKALCPIVKDSAVLSFPSKHWFRTPFRKFRYSLRNCPVYFYDEHSIQDLCRAAGFKSVNIQKIPGAGMDFHVCLKP